MKENDIQKTHSTGESLAPQGRLLNLSVLTSLIAGVRKYMGTKGLAIIGIASVLTSCGLPSNKESQKPASQPIKSQPIVPKSKKPQGEYNENGVRKIEGKEREAVLNLPLGSKKEKSER